MGSGTAKRRNLTCDNTFSKPDYTLENTCHHTKQKYVANITIKKNGSFVFELKNKTEYPLSLAPAIKSKEKESTLRLAIQEIMPPQVKAVATQRLPLKYTNLFNCESNSQPQSPQPLYKLPIKKIIKAGNSNHKNLNHLIA